jgi:hypothetical protein
VLSTVGDAVPWWRIVTVDGGYPRHEVRDPAGAGSGACPIRDNHVDMERAVGALGAESENTLPTLR